MTKESFSLGKAAPMIFERVHEKVSEVRIETGRGALVLQQYDFHTQFKANY